MNGEGQQLNSGGNHARGSTVKIERMRSSTDCLQLPSNIPAGGGGDAGAGGGAGDVDSFKSTTLFRVRRGLRSQNS